MNHCGDSPAAEPGARACETCTERGSPVQLQTVKALLTEIDLRRVQLTHYRIGEIAERTGVSVETLRYYEKRRLLNAPPRTQGGYRVYSDAVVHQVKFIKQAQSLGLTLEDIQQLAAGRLRTNHAPSCRKVRDLLTRRIEDIDARIKELREFRRTLHDHLTACDRALASAAEPACPTIEALDEPKRASRRHEAR